MAILDAVATAFSGEGAPKAAQAIDPMIFRGRRCLHQ
jgi:hypothetical protein